MPRREVDTNRAVCDTCGKLYQKGDAVYTVADKYEEGPEGQDILVSFRHWDCHTPIDVALKNVKTKIKDAEALLNKLKGWR